MPKPAQINPLAEKLKDWTPAHQPSLPKPSRTPRPELGRVVSNPVLAPVNRQALRLLFRNYDWLAEPPPQLKPDVSRGEFDRLTAALKTEFNSHADTRDKLGQANARIRALTAEKAALQQTQRELEAKIQALQDTLRQLEDLKL